MLLFLTTQLVNVRTTACYSEHFSWPPCVSKTYWKHLQYAAAKEERIPDDLWVQCDFPQCLKWRKMPRGTDPTSLPDNWFCYNHPDPAMAALSHVAPEEEYKVPAEAEVGVACGTWFKAPICSSVQHTASHAFATMYSQQLITNTTLVMKDNCFPRGLHTFALIISQELPTQLQMLSECVVHWPCSCTMPTAAGLMLQTAMHLTQRMYRKARLCLLLCVRCWQ